MNTAPVKTFFAVSLLAAASFMSAVKADEQASDQLKIQQQMQQVIAETLSADAPGAAILVRRGDDILLRAGYGMANLELAVPMQADMVFRIASQTKQFTAVAILQLVAQGKLQLQQTIGQLLPAYPLTGRNITVEQLLTHTSGIPNLSRLPAFRQQLALDTTLSELLPLFNELPLQFAPGTAFTYSNSNYVVLTAIIEALSGQNYNDYLQQHIFTPLQMSQSGYDVATKLVAKRAQGYQQSESGFSNASTVSMTRPQGAGGLLSSVDDLNRWDLALYKNTLVPAALLQKAFTPVKLADGSSVSYGFGWMVSQLQGVASAEHGGAIEGFMSHSVRLPEQKVFVTVLANSEHVDATALALKLAAIAIERPLVTEDQSLDAATIQKISGEYLFADNSQRRIFAKDGQLFSQRHGGSPVRLIADGHGKFYFAGDFNYLTFNADKGSMTVAYHQRLTGVITGHRKTQAE